MQRLLEMFFFSGVVVLSYIATLHLLTNRLGVANSPLTSSARSTGIQMSGPVPLRPMVGSKTTDKKKAKIRKLSSSKKHFSTSKGKKNRNVPKGKKQIIHRY